MKSKSLSHKPLKLYWYASPQNKAPKNFGDALSQEICKILSGREVVFAEPNSADLLAVGSILNKLSDRFFSRRTKVWGSGFMCADDTQRARHEYFALRGHLTAKRINGLKCLPALGDPGLLVDRIYPDVKAFPKSIEICLIPHMVEKSSPSVKYLQEKYPAMKVLDVRLPPEQFVGSLATCSFVLSSSLHGLIAADSLGIPNCWVELSKKVKGDGFKFHDYYSVFGMIPPLPLTPDTVTDVAISKARDEWHRPGLERIKDDLVESFPFKATCI